MNDTLEVILVAGAGAGALAAVAALLRSIGRTTRRIVHIADAVNELVPNGGSSIKDQITRIEVGQRELRADFATHLEQHHSGVTSG